MNKDQMIKWGVIVGGGVLAYWYVTSYGPDGAVKDGHVSWWNTWFGTGTPAPVPGQNQTAPGFPNQPAQTQPGPTQPVLTQPSQPAPATINTAVRQQILTASAGNPAIQGGYATPDVWSYYWQQVTGRNIAPGQLATAFPPTSTGTGAPLNLDQFLSGLAGVGLSGIGAIVPAPSAPSVPSMSFGGSFRRPGMRGMGGRGFSPAGGPTIQ